MKLTTQTNLNPAIYDIARVAQVRLAINDRVLNTRPAVRKKPVRKVNKAIAELSHARDAAAAKPAWGPVYGFVFIPPAIDRDKDKDKEFVLSLQAQIDQFNINLRHDRTGLSVVRAKQGQRRLNMAQEQMRIDLYLKENIPPLHSGALGE